MTNKCRYHSVLLNKLRDSIFRCKACVKITKSSNGHLVFCNYHVVIDIIVSILLTNNWGVIVDLALEKRRQLENK